MLTLGLGLAVVNLIWLTMLAISALRLVDNPIYLRSVATIVGIAVAAVILRLKRLRVAANVVNALQLLISVYFLVEVLGLGMPGVEGMAY